MKLLFVLFIMFAYLIRITTPHILAMFRHAPGISHRACITLGGRTPWNLNQLVSSAATTAFCGSVMD